MGWRATQAVLPLDVGSPTAKAVLLCLAARANDDFECWPSYNTLAKDACMSRSTAIRQVETLCKLGVLAADPRGHGHGQKSNMYRIQVPIEGSVTVTPPSVSLTPPSSTVTPESVINQSVKRSSLNMGNLDEQDCPTGERVKAQDERHDLIIQGFWTGDDRRVDIKLAYNNEEPGGIVNRIATALEEQSEHWGAYDTIAPAIRKKLEEEWAAGHRGITVNQLGNLAASLMRGMDNKAGRPW
ncbi:helix-turn-helix domain-containing protein [Aeromonas caviae]|uniref:helix-turn-helix domain-containing protein n=1 Tax=Aeromonas caviae TaxID=648 RepID=UPI001CF0C510|nr:helix-turn-helix domain-containing protein [Aeromonas caviae]UCM48822.1 helix-turn-helix domain-containing protein [Aeromonas caviae]